MDTYHKAYQIVQTLQKAGYVAYFAGGWVRDFFLKHPSDDIDIVTSASPTILQSLFTKTIPVGIAFGIIIIRIEDKEFEVATFRKDLEYKDGRRPSKIEFTEEKVDAQRRDFTINGLFYDPVQNKMYDYVEGKKDIEHKIIRAIGNPHERISEDRLRMIRAIRYATRFNFIIEPNTKQAILDHRTELFPAVAIERIVQEFTKMHNYHTLRPSLLMLHQYGLLQVIFTQLENSTYEEIEKRLRPLSDFPPKTPLVAGLMLLFKSIDKNTIDDLCSFLKLSNQERLFAHYLYKGTLLVNQPNTQYDLAYFYAHRDNTVVLEIIGSYNSNTKEEFLSKHFANRKKLQPHIERIQRKQPLIQAKDLLDLGIRPGPLMGTLLIEAEKISINQNIQEKDKVIKKLQESDFWKNSYIS